MLRWKKILLALLVLVLLVPLLVIWLAPPASSSPPFTVPTPNGYDQLLQAAESLQGDPLTATNQPSAFVEKNSATYDLLQTALSLASEAPLFAYDQASAVRLQGDYVNFKLLAHALQLKGRSLETNNPSAALNAYLDIIRLGQRVEHGPVINLMIGLSFEKMGLNRATQLAPSLSPFELDHYRETLRSLHSARIPFSEVSKREEYYRRRNTRNPFHSLISRSLLRRGFQRAKARHELISSEFNAAITNTPPSQSLFHN